MRSTLVNAAHKVLALLMQLSQKESTKVHTLNFINQKNYLKNFAELQEFTPAKRIYILLKKKIA